MQQRLPDMGEVAIHQGHAGAPGLAWRMAKLGGQFQAAGATSDDHDPMRHGFSLLLDGGRRRAPSCDAMRYLAIFAPWREEHTPPVSAITSPASMSPSDRKSVV